jgi:hypothetical protein
VNNGNITKVYTREDLAMNVVRGTWNRTAPPPLSGKSISGSENVPSFDIGEESRKLTAYSARLNQLNTSAQLVFNLKDTNHDEKVSVLEEMAWQRRSGSIAQLLPKAILKTNAGFFPKIRALWRFFCIVHQSRASNKLKEKPAFKQDAIISFGEQTALNTMIQFALAIPSNNFYNPPNSHSIQPVKPAISNPEVLACLLASLANGLQRIRDEDPMEQAIQRLEASFRSSSSE